MGVQGAAAGIFLKTSQAAHATGECCWWQAAHATGECCWWEG